DLGTDFREVKSIKVRGKRVLRFEQMKPVGFPDRPSDVLMEVVKVCRGRLWPVVRSTPPYRRYYVYLGPTGTLTPHPMCSVYLIVYFLGSVTRYRPHHFSTIE